MFRILFICTDNVGRSVTAEYLLRDILKKEGRRDIIVSSAGINANSDVSSFCFAHLDKLAEMGIDTSRHKRKQVTREILDEANLVLVMDEEQQRWIKENFGRETVLYNYFYNQKKISFYISPSGSLGTLEEKCLEMVKYFNKTLPVVLEKINEML